MGMKATFSLVTQTLFDSADKCEFIQDFFVFLKIDNNGDPLAPASNQRWTALLDDAIDN